MIACQIMVVNIWSTFHLHKCKYRMRKATEPLNVHILKDRKRSLERIAREDRFTMTRVVEDLIEAEVERRRQEKEKAEA